MVAEHKEENNQKNSEKAAADKKHDGHTDSNPEKNETDHPLHNGLLVLAVKMLYYMCPQPGYVTAWRGRGKFLDIRGENRKKGVFIFGKIGYNMREGRFCGSLRQDK